MTACLPAEVVTLGGGQYVQEGRASGVELLYRNCYISAEALLQPRQTSRSVFVL